MAAYVGGAVHLAHAHGLPSVPPQQVGADGGVVALEALAVAAPGGVDLQQHVARRVERDLLERRADHLPQQSVYSYQTPLKPQAVATKIVGRMHQTTLRHLTLPVGAV